LNQIASSLDIKKLERKIKLHGFSLGDDNSDKAYRKWALEETLFLNPLNDLGSHSVAAVDSFVLPSFTTKLDEPPTWLGFFNQLKQEYVSARWMLYEGTHTDDIHFSDREVKLYDTLDYPSYGLSVERVKMAFRMAYSLFDKIAFFLNDYAKLGIPEKQVYFRSLWYANQDQRTGALRPVFAQLKNWPWRGLYWLSKDLFDEQLKASADPDAQELYTIRNQLEHKYLKLREMAPRTTPGDPFHDRLAYSLARDDFTKKTLRVLKLGRAAMIYLALGMEQEEARRNAAKGESDKISVPMFLDTLDDDWKR
jgi:hypothetical protein